MAFRDLVVACPHCAKNAISIQDFSEDGDSLDACPHCMYLMNPRNFSPMAEGRVSEWQYLIDNSGMGSLSGLREYLSSIDISDLDYEHCYTYPEDPSEAEALTKLGGMSQFNKRVLHRRQYAIYHPSVSRMVRETIEQVHLSISRCGNTPPNPAVDMQAFIKYDRSLDIDIPF